MTHTALAVTQPAKPIPYIEDSTVLTPVDESYLVSMVEVARSIVRRHQFFLWARGVLQSLVPHEILLCGYGDLRRHNFTVDRFAGRPFPEPMYEAFCDPREGLMAQAHAMWDGNGYAPLPVCPSDAKCAASALFTGTLQRHHITNCVFHGVPQMNGSPSAFFCFANVPAPLTRRTAYLVELVVPSIYAAHLRVMHGERRGDDNKAMREPSRPRVATLPRAITGREVQILQWVQEGKSNREIGEVLKISPLTVKNHVQNILKKLKVRNRAQAVSRAIGARLILSSAQGAAPERLVRTAQSKPDV